jgi:hypothetical protein
LKPPNYSREICSFEENPGHKMAKSWGASGVFSEKRTRDFGACRVGIEEERKKGRDIIFTAVSA